MPNKKISKIQSSMKNMLEFLFLSRRWKCVYVSKCISTVAGDRHGRQTIYG